MKFRNSLPILIIVVLALIPVARWFFIDPMSLRFFDLNSTTTSLGQIAGLSGMILFSINLILSNRTKFFDRIFSGLHNFYNYHKQIGMLSFCLILFHPLFLVVKYASISINSAAVFLLPGNNFPVTMGIIALGMMIVLLVITIYLKIKYHIWRFSHKFMTLVFVFAILHVLFISSDISRDIFLRYYILIFAFVGLLLGAYRAFFRIFFNKDFEFKIINVNILNNNVTEIEMEPANSKVEFLPGQFIFIRFVGVGISSESHPFSITSRTGENNMKIVVKSLGDYTSKINNLSPGMIAKVEGPFGSFFKNRNTSKREIWIAGGVGITPFLSLARNLKNIENEIDLYYCLNEKSEAVFLTELENISNSNKKVRIVPWYSKEKGFINADKIKEISGDVRNTEIYTCGPLGFMQALKEQFIKLGVENKNIYLEEFNFL